MHEIVEVVGASVLISSRRLMCRYVTGDGNPLDPGFYLVIWSKRSLSRAYDKSARYIGPFPSRIRAEELLASGQRVAVADECAGR
jgi:hypothetical protein